LPQSGFDWEQNSASVNLQFQAVGRKRKMKSKARNTVLALLPIAGLTALSASSERNGVLHVTKECSQYNGAAGAFCTITSSNVTAIKVGARVYYDQAADVPKGLLDSNVVLDAGNGNRAVGRCTLDGVTNLGLCTFSDGVGQFAGFQARIDVSPFSSSPTEVNYHWDGTYSFNPQQKDAREQH